MKEIEVFSSIPEKEFKRKIKEFTKKYGKPKVVKRLGIIFSSYTNWNDVDTRLKITNGQIEVVQKLGGGLNADGPRIEKEIPVKMKAKQLKDLVRIFQNMGKGVEGFTCPLQQYHNTLFDTPNSEVKFYVQFNDKNAFYGFEVEATKRSLDLNEECSNLGLTLDAIKRDEDYWYKYDQTYNMETSSMTDLKLLALLKKYMSYRK